MAPSTSKRQINYVVFAHPDDEYASWSLIAKASDNYPVFLMLTRGEQSGYCPGPAFNSGEERYSPYLPAAKGSPNCITARINSFHLFLRGMAQLDSALEDPPYIGPRTGVSGYGTVSDRGYLLHAGSKAALLIFNLGDSSLQENEVVWALRSAQQARQNGDLPSLPEYAVIAASYSNFVTYGDPRYPPPPGCGKYEHLDHRAVHTAVYNTDFGTAGPQWGATALCDPDPGRTSKIDLGTHDHAFEKYPSSTNLGVWQRQYGWLFGGYPGYYTFTDRYLQQRHWQRFG